MRGWTLSELARRSGVSKATLSGLETGLGNPNLETLVAVSNALEIAFNSLFGDQTQLIDVQRASTGPQFTSTSSSFVAHLQASTGPVRDAEFFTFELDDSSDYEAEPHPSGSMETVVCVSGRAAVGPTGEEVELEVGDRVSFRADRPHRYQALTTSSVLTSVVTYQ